MHRLQEVRTGHGRRIRDSRQLQPESTNCNRCFPPHRHSQARRVPRSPRPCAADAGRHGDDRREQAAKWFSSPHFRGRPEVASCFRHLRRPRRAMLRLRPLGGDAPTADAVALHALPSTETVAVGAMTLTPAIRRSSTATLAGTGRSRWSSPCSRASSSGRRRDPFAPLGGTGADGHRRPLPQRARRRRGALCRPALRRWRVAAPPRRASARPRGLRGNQRRRT